MPRMIRQSLLFAAAFLLLGCAQPVALNPRLLLTPDNPAFTQPAPALFHVRLHTTKGDIDLEIHRDWSPHGVDRFYNLVRAGYYDDTRFFRVIRDRWAQFGINGHPAIARQ